MTRIPRRLWLLSGLEAVAVLLVVGLAAWLLARARPALGAAWTPRLPAVLALGTVAAASGPGAVALAARILGVRRSVARVFGLAATLATAWATLALTLALTISPLRGSGEGGATHGWFAWLALTIGSGTLVGMLFLSFTRLRPDPEHVGVLVRLNDVDGGAAAHAFAAGDGHRQVEPLGRELVHAARETVPLRGARRVAAHRFVPRLGNGEYGVHRSILPRPWPAGAGPLSAGTLLTGAARTARELT